MWYLMMASIEHDVDVQRRGTVDVFYLIGGDILKIPSPTSENVQLPKQIHDSIPRRVVGLHALYDDPRMGPLMYIIPLLLSTFKLIRFRSHYGMCTAPKSCSALQTSNSFISLPCDNTSTF